MDAIDEKLILALRENGRASTAQLARLVGRSRTSVQSRIERLEKQGVIVGYGVRLAPEHGLGAVRAHVMVKVGAKETRAVTAALRAIAQVRVLHSVSGEVGLDRGGRDRLRRRDGSGHRSHRGARMASSAPPRRSFCRPSSSAIDRRDL